MKILIATENDNKLRELSKILPKTVQGEAVEYIGLKDLDKPFTLPEEDRATIEENAALKAAAAAKFSGLPALADDTGLEVDALNGAPGVRSARYAGEIKDEKENNLKLLHELDGLLLNQRTARFRTAASLALPDGFTAVEEGVLEGFIGFGYRGDNGFGYDPIFIVKGKDKTLAEMSAEEKNTVSHRKSAFEKISKLLASCRAAK
ncbi:RdgB/HAM1 family non-canonical purine NTP pyrophosphatase [Parelusimicrobium proximum]|uniref:RdgB/HAM1 family non-canonical purine NTP pyrophosphatase n=1 Tax=Parelusimicrobium proximum TaxID=3228953 RepID=UPI003D184C70